MIDKRHIEELQEMLIERGFLNTRCDCFCVFGVGKKPKTDDGWTWKIQTLEDLIS